MKRLYPVWTRKSRYYQSLYTFVPIVEEGWSDSKIALLTAEKYLDSMRDEDIDSLLLGCTHYPLLEDAIGKVMGPGVRLINPAEATALEVGRILKAWASSTKMEPRASMSSFVSDLGEKFEELAGVSWAGR